MGKYTDFSQSYIWIAGAAPQIERKAAWVLAEEIEKRTGIRLPVENEPLSGRPYLYIGSSVPEELADGIESLAAPGTEGCRILVDGGRAAAVGADPRGCMYGAGRLLRMMKW